MPSGRQQHGYLSIVILGHDGVFIGVEPAEHAYPDALASPAPALAFKYFYHAHLRGRGQVRRTAGADIHAFYLNDADVFRELQLAAVLKLFQHLLRRERGAYFMVRRDREICLSLELCKLLPCQLAVEIYGDKIASHVEADIVVPVFLMHKPRHNMLAGVILHSAEAYFPVDRAVVFRSDGERLVYIM